MKLLTGCLVLTVALFTGCQSRSSGGTATAKDSSTLPPLKTVSHVDLPRYMGDWYVIANIPYFAEEGKVATIERYQLMPDGKIENTFIFRKDSFDEKQKEWHATAEVTNVATNAEWKVQFFWPFKLEYRIIDLAPDYSWAVVAHPSRDYFWVLSRSRSLPDATYRGILNRAAAQGIDVTQVTKVPQPTN